MGTFLSNIRQITHTKRLMLRQKRSRSQLETGVFGGCNARVREREGYTNLTRTALRGWTVQYGHSSRCCRFSEIAAPLTLPYRTPRLPAPALPPADAALEAQDQGLTELRRIPLPRTPVNKKGKREGRDC